MKILILGAGAVGGYFGGRLVEAGADVEFLVRPSRAGALQQNGLKILSPFGDYQGPVQTVTAENLKPHYDLVIFTCKSYGLSEAIKSIQPAIGAHTVILPLLNGISHLDTLDQAFGKPHVAGGSCHLSATLGPGGEIVHLNQTHKIIFGERDKTQLVLMHSLKELFAKTKADAEHSNDIALIMWEKFIFITTLAGLTCLMRADMGTITQTRHGKAMTREMMEICRTTAERAGANPDPTRLEAMTRGILAEGSPLKASMLRDIENGSPTEGEHLVGHMTQLAEQHGLDCKLLQIALTHLQAYELQRKPG